MNASSIIKIWRDDPIKFAVDNFGDDLDEWQADALMKLSGAQLTPRRRVVLKAATGVGKSRVISIAGWHRLVCFADRGEHPKGAALSGEGRDNLRDNLWSELAKLRARSEFLMRSFELTQEKIFAREHPETWFLSARSYAKDADTEALGRSLSGLHSSFPFVLLDETGDMPVTVGQKAEQIFTGGVRDGLIIQAGNPTSTNGLLYHSCVKLRDIHEIITITSDPDDPKRSPRVDPDHAREMIKRYGRESPWVKATILGEFPESGLNTLLSVDEVEQAIRREVREDDYSFAQRRIGVDCARFGSDFTCLFPRQGLRAFRPVMMSGARSHEIAARVAVAKSKWGSELEFVDDTGGYGAGVIDSLIQGGFTPMPVNFSGKADDPRYFNKRSEIWFRMAEWVKRGGWLPDVPSLVEELTAPVYTFQAGKFRLEEKDQIKSRIGKSPDMADALALTFTLPDMPGQMSVIHPTLVQKSNETKHEWDPYHNA